MNEQQLAEIEARAAMLPWNTGIGCTLEGITYYAHGRSDDEDRALIETLGHLKTDLPALVAEVRRLRALVGEQGT